MQELLSARDAAKVIKISPPTVQYMVERGELKPTAVTRNEVGGVKTYLFDPEYIREFARNYRDGRRKSA